MAFFLSLSFFWLLLSKWNALHNQTCVFYVLEVSHCFFSSFNLFATSMAGWIHLVCDEQKKFVIHPKRWDFLYSVTTESTSIRVEKPDGIFRAGGLVKTSVEWSRDFWGYVVHEFFSAYEDSSQKCYFSKIHKVCAMELLSTLMVVRAECTGTRCVCVWVSEWVWIRLPALCVCVSVWVHIREVREGFVGKERKWF